MAAASPRPSPWLFGRAPDLLFGCGLAYILVFVALVAFGPETRVWQPHVLFPLFVLLVGSPHYGATIVRVYESRRERRAYAVFSVGASILLLGAFVAGLEWPVVGSLLLTLYLSWSPWHYTGQNYGVSVMFLRRAGVDLDPLSKRWLYASFLLSFAFVLGVMHSASGNAGDRLFAYQSQSVLFLPIGLPGFVTSLLPVLLLGQLLALGVATLRLRRACRLRQLAPMLLIAITQSLWFSVPFAIRFFDLARVPEALSWDYRTHYFIWIAVGHGVQYLWVTSYFAKRSPSWSGGTNYALKVTLAGVGLWTLPTVVFGPAGLGLGAIDGSLALVLASCINLHHFILDGAIWKLRGRIGKVLIRDVPDDAVDAPGERGGWIRPAVWASCGVGVALAVFVIAQEEISASALRTDDLARARTAEARLGWIGRDRASSWLALGKRELAAGRLSAARADFERSTALADLPGAWLGLAQTYEVVGDWAGAARVYEDAMRAAGERPRLLRSAARAWIEAGESERAKSHAERLVQLRPKDASAQELLARSGGGA